MSTSSHMRDSARLASVRTLPGRYLREAAEVMAERKELGERIAKARRAKRWKQKHLAAAVNVEPTTVSRWETGVHTPDFDMLDRLAKELEQPISYFVDPIPAAAAPPSGDLSQVERVEAVLVQVMESAAEMAQSAATIAEAVEEIRLSLGVERQPGSNSER